MIKNLVFREKMKIIINLDLEVEIEIDNKIEETEVTLEKDNIKIEMLIKIHKEILIEISKD